MKKILFLLCAAALFNSCDKDDDNNSERGHESTYVCTLKVTDAATGTTTNEARDIICMLEEQKDKSLSLTMKEIKFTDNVREPVKTIVIKRLAARDDPGSSTQIYSTEATIVPEIGGTPYPDYQISGFNCLLNSDATLFRLVFTCTNPTYRINHTADFSGRISK